MGIPKQKNIKPRYDQRTFNLNDRLNKWQIVVSPLEEDKAPLDQPGCQILTYTIGVRTIH
jgi:hypothetical protein